MESSAPRFVIARAELSDIPEMHRVRLSVRENVLSDLSRVQPSDYEAMIVRKGEGWVCRVDGELRGFSVADIEASNIWALFVEPGFEGRGVGRALHDRALGSLSKAGAKSAWLRTSSGTRAEKFYASAGWRCTRVEPDGDLYLVIDLTSLLPPGP